MIPHSQHLNLNNTSVVPKSAINLLRSLFPAAAFSESVADTYVILVRKHVVCLGICAFIPVNQPLGKTCPQFEMILEAESDANVKAEIERPLLISGLVQL